MTSTVAAAQRQLKEAQDALTKAQAAENFEALFDQVGEVFLVVARVPSFDQFVGYSETGIILGVFAEQADAEEYRAGAEKPVGTELRVEPMALRAAQF